MHEKIRKGKSIRRSTTPYERPKSILRRVTDSVTGLLPQPSWLSSWLERPPQDEDIEESEVEEMQGPSTSMCSESTETISEGEQAQQSTSFIFQKPQGLSQDQSKTDPKSHRGRKTLSLHTFSQDSILLSPSTDGFNKESEGASDGDLSQSQFCSASKRPRFDMISFRPSAAEGRKPCIKSVVDSPFYAGRTTYGGASAYRRATLQPSASPFPYVRQRVYARPYSNSSAPSTPVNGSLPTVSMTSNVVLSSTAQRFLRAMETTSTPVRDAQRIPTSNNSVSSSIRDDEPSFTGYGLSRRRPNLGPPVTKLSIATKAQIVPRQETKKTPFDAITSSTPIHSQGGGKFRTGTSVSDYGLKPKSLQEEKDINALLTVVEPFKLAGNLPSFNLLAPPLSTPPLASASKTPEALTPQLPPSPKAPISTEQAITSTLASPTMTTRLISPPLMNGSPSSSIPQNFNISPTQSATPDSTEAEERPTAVLKPDVEPVASKSVPIGHSEINAVGEPNQFGEESKKTASPTMTARLIPPPLMTRSPSSSTLQSFNISSTQSVTRDSTEAEERPTAVLKPDVEPVASTSVPIGYSEINTAGEPNHLEEESKKTPQATEPLNPVTTICKDSEKRKLIFKKPVPTSSGGVSKKRWKAPSVSSESSAPKPALRPGATVQPSTDNDDKGPDKGALTGYTSPSNQPPLSFSDPQEESNKPSEEPKRQLLSEPTSGSPFASTSLATGDTSAAAASAISVKNDLFISEEFPSGQESSVQPSTPMKTGGLFSFIEKKPEAAEVSYTGFLPVSASSASNNFTSASTFAAGGEQPKSISSFPILPTTTEAAPSPFGSFTPTPHLSGGQASVTTRAATLLQPSTAPGTLLRYGPPTPGAAAVPFTPNSAAPSSLFGFGPPTTGAAAVPFTPNSAAPSSLFGFGATSTNRALTTTTSSKSSLGLSSFPPTTSTAPTTSAIQLSGLFSFGDSSKLSNAQTFDEYSETTKQPTFGNPPSTSFGSTRTHAFGVSSTTPSAFFGAPTAPPQGTAFNAVSNFGVYPLGNTPAANASFGPNSNSSFASTPSGPPPNSNSFGGAAPAAVCSTGFAGVNAQAANTGYPIYPKSSYVSTPSGPPPNSSSFGGAASAAVSSTGFTGVNPLGNAQAANTGYPIYPKSSFASTPSGPPPNSSSFSGAAPVATGSTGFVGVNAQAANTGYPFYSSSSFASTPSGPPPNSNSFGGAAPAVAGSTGFGGVHSFGNTSQSTNTGFPFNPSSSFASAPSGPPQNVSFSGISASAVAGSTATCGMFQIGNTPSANTSLGFNSGFNWNSSSTSTPSGPPPNLNPFGGVVPAATGFMSPSGVPQFESTQTANMGVPFSPNSSFGSTPSGPPPGGAGINVRRTLKAIRKCVQRQPN